MGAMGFVFAQGEQDQPNVPNADTIPAVSAMASAPQFACNAMAFGQGLLDYPESVQRAVNAYLVELYRKHYCADEGVMMGYTAWLVSALV